MRNEQGPWEDNFDIGSLCNGTVQLAMVIQRQLLGIELLT